MLVIVLICALIVIIGLFTLAFGTEWLEGDSDWDYTKGD